MPPLVRFCVASYIRKRQLYTLYIQYTHIHIPTRAYIYIDPILLWNPNHHQKKNTNCPFVRNLVVILLFSLSRLRFSFSTSVRSPDEIILIMENLINKKIFILLLQFFCGFSNCYNVWCCVLQWEYFFWFWFTEPARNQRIQIRIRFWSPFVAPRYTPFRDLPHVSSTLPGWNSPRTIPRWLVPFLVSDC